MQAAKALASLRICADSPRPSLLADAISTEISCTGPNFIRYYINRLKVCLFVLLFLRPKSTAMVMAGRSVHLTTLFPG